MIRRPSSRTFADPGAAKVSEIATHWRVCNKTVRAIVAFHGLERVVDSPQRYRWMDIWRIEGEAFVPEWDWPGCKAPLLEASDLVDNTLRGWSGRSVRRKLETGRLPSISLTPDIRRIRPQVVERLRGYL